MLINKTYIDKAILINSEGKNFGTFGVFAKEDIKTNEIIEECPGVLIKNYDDDNDYHSFVIYDSEKTYYVSVLGHGMIYNHKNVPNATWYFDKKNNIIRFYALQNINKNEEIFHNYKIEINYIPENFNLKTVLKSINLNEYKKLSFPIDTKDILEFINS